jgi:hypothetical protein
MGPPEIGLPHFNGNGMGESFSTVPSGTLHLISPASIPTLEAHDAVVLALDETPDVVEGEVVYPRTFILVQGFD